MIDQLAQSFDIAFSLNMVYFIVFMVCGTSVSYLLAIRVVLITVLDYLFFLPVFEQSFGWQWFASMACIDFAIAYWIRWKAFDSATLVVLGCSILAAFTMAAMSLHDIYNQFIWLDQVMVTIIDIALIAVAIRSRVLIKRG